MGSRISSYLRGQFNWFSAMVLLMSQLVFPVLVVQPAFAADVPSNETAISSFGFVIPPQSSYDEIAGVPTAVGGFNNGNVGAYVEGACIPSLLEITNNSDSVGDIPVSPIYDFLSNNTAIENLEMLGDSGTVGNALDNPRSHVDNLNDFTYSGIPLSSATTFVGTNGAVSATSAGPFSGNDASTSATTGADTFRHYNIVLQDVDPDETVYITFCARLGLDSSEYTGSSLSIRTAQGGAENIPIPVNQLLRRPSITISKVVVGGSALPSDFSFNVTPSIDGQSSYSIAGGETSVLIDDIFPDGDYTITENPVDGYEFTSGTGTSCTFDTSTATATIVAAKNPTNAECEFTNTEIQGATLILEKTVTNDDGGTLTQANFLVAIDGDSSTWGSHDVDAGDYVVSETTQPGYAAGDWGGDCDADGNVTLAPGETKTCTITNNDIAPHLSIQKIAINDDGGEIKASEFSLYVNGDLQTDARAGGANDTSSTIIYAYDAVAGTPYTVTEDEIFGYDASDVVCKDTSTELPVSHPVTLSLAQSVRCTITNNDIAPKITVVKTVTSDDGGELVVSSFPLYVDGDLVVSSEQNDWTAGTFDVTEDQQDGYTFTGFTGDCGLDGSITLEIGSVYTCTLGNDDIPAKIIVKKVVVNDDGGTANVSAFDLFVDAIPVVHGATNTFNGNANYAISEKANADGYKQTSLVCQDITDLTNKLPVDNGFKALLGHTYECVITNDDIAPTLTLEKTVINNTGGTLGEAAFQAKIDGSEVKWDTATALAAGAHTASEVEVLGYAASSWGGDCNKDGSITLSPGQDATCTITNDDQPGTLTLVKTVVNNDGGTAVASQFQASIDVVTKVDWDVATPVNGGDHKVSETTLPGYTAGNWTGDCAADGNVSLLVGENKTCYITNDDVPATLTLIKSVSNDDGGDADQSEWTLTAQGASLLQGIDPTASDATGLTGEVSAGQYSLSESGGQDGYVLTSIKCEGETVSLHDPKVDIGLGDSVTCVFTNDDIAPELTVTKYATNDDGGTVTADKFDLFVNGGVPLAGGNTGTPSGDTTIESYGPNDIESNKVYTVTETLPTGYEKTSQTCFNITNGLAGAPVISHPFSVEEGEKVLCNVNNDDIAPTLTIVKTVVNNNGGTAVEGDFQGRIAGDAVNWDTATEVAANKKITASEDKVDGYTASDWGGDCAKDGTIILLPGEDKTCTVTNDDQAPEITLLKIVVDEYGSGYEADDWTLTAKPAANLVGATELSGNGEDGVGDEDAYANVVYTLSEDGPDGFDPTDWNCYGKGGFNQVDDTVILDLGADVTCVITNDAIAPHLIVIKNVINDDHVNPENGRVAGDFTIFVDAIDVSDDKFPGEKAPGTDLTLDVGAYKVYEDGYNVRQMGYAESYSDDCIGEISLGETKTCIVTNDDIAPTLRLVKRARSVSDPITQEFELFARQPGHVTFGSPYTVDVNGDSDTPRKVVIDEDDGLKAGPVRIGENVPENWILRDITCSPTNRDNGPRVGVNDLDRDRGPQENPLDIRLAPGDDVTCTFLNVEKAKVTVTKYWDVDQDGRQDENEPTLPDWTFELERCRNYGYRDTDVNINTPQILLPPIDTACTQLINDAETSVESLEYMYERVQPAITDENGVAMFNGLAPFGQYVLSEQFQDGWNISGISCDYPEQQANGIFPVFSPNRYDIFTYPGAQIECQVGNYPDGNLLISKTNDRIGENLIAGDTVNYTITVTNPVESGISFSTVTYDLLPAGVTYVAGSGSATSSVDGVIASPLDGADYVAAGPASWEIGDLEPGEVVWHNYAVTIDDETDPGTYENIAFVEGWACSYESLEFLEVIPESNSVSQDSLEASLTPDFYDNPEYEENENPCPFGLGSIYDFPTSSDVTANSHSVPGFASLVAIFGNQVDGSGDPFVESAISIVEASEPQSFVLGITTLVNTGTPAILPPAIGLLIAGMALALSGAGRRKKIQLFSRIASASKHLVIALVLVAGLGAGSASAATGDGWQLNVVDLPDATPNSSLDIAYQVISTGVTEGATEDTFTVTLYQDGVMIDSAAIATPLGDNGFFTVNGLADGTYEFKVVAENSNDAEPKPNTQTVVVDSVAPTSVVYEGVVQNGNEFTLTFTVPAGSDATTVNVYSSTAMEFVADSTTLVGSVAATPGAEQTFTYTAPNDDVRYFAIELVDGAGNASSLVGDEETVVTGGATADGAAGDSATAETADEDEDASVLGDEIGDPIVTGELDPDEDADDTNSAWYLVGVGAMIVVLWFFLQQRAARE